MGGKSRKEARGLGSYSGRGREKRCPRQVVLEPQELGDHGTKNEASGQAVPGFLASPLGKLSLLFMEAVPGLGQRTGPKIQIW